MSDKSCCLAVLSVGRPNYSWVRGNQVLSRDDSGRVLRLNDEIVESATVTRDSIVVGCVDSPPDVKTCGWNRFSLDADGDLWLGPTKLASNVDRIVGVEGSRWYLTYESGGQTYSISQFDRTPRKR